ARELGGDEARRGRVRGQVVEELLPVLDTAPRGQLEAEDLLRLRVVVGGGVDELPARLFRRDAQAVDGPAREAARGRHHVVLRVAGGDAERVQLHQLAAVVLVEPELAPAAADGVLPAQGVVDVGQRRGRRGGGSGPV